MANINIPKSIIPNVDMFDTDQEHKAIKAGVSGEYRGRAQQALSQYVIGVAFNRRLKAGDKQGDLIAEHGVKQSQVSKLTGVARVIDSHVNGDDKAFENLPNVDREAVAAHRRNLMTYWGHHFDGVEDAPSFLGTCGALIGDDGEARVPALATFFQVYGSPSSAYMVMTGAKLHDNDPRNDDQDDESGDDEDESGDDEDKVSWQDRMAALVSQAKLEGATASDILGVVNAALKGE